MCGLLFVCVKQKTAYEMRISDWGSDVCSSHLVYRYSRHAIGQGRSEDGVAADLEALLPGLTDATHDHILNRHGIDAGPLDHAVQDLASQICRMPASQSATARSAERRVGTECVSTCRSRWSPYHYKKNTILTNHKEKSHTIEKK